MFPTAASAVMSHTGRERLSAFVADEVQRDGDARGDACARREPPIDNEHAIVDHQRIRRQGTQRVQQFVMRRATPRVEQSAACGEQRAGADRDQPVWAVRIA